MASIDSVFFDLGRLDSLSYGETFIHRLDSRTKLLATMAFIVTVVSFPKHEITGLIPFFCFPIMLVSLANLPIGFLLSKLVVLSPFALLIGIFNPLLDRQVMVYLGSFAITGGWVSFGSLMIRFVLTVGAALILIATTSFPGVCGALERLKVPKIFVVQLMFLYRFIFVLTEEALRIVRASSTRNFGKKAVSVKLFVRLLGNLFLRTVDRAERVYWAMCNRGFDGEIRMLKRSRFGGRDIAFLSASVALFILFRVNDLSQLVGTLAFEVFGQ